MTESFTRSLINDLGKVGRYERTSFDDAKNQRLSDVEKLQQERDNKKAELIRDPDRRVTFGETVDLFTAQLQMEQQACAPLKLPRSLVFLNRYRLGLGAKSITVREGPLPFEVWFNSLGRRQDTSDKPAENGNDHEEFEQSRFTTGLGVGGATAMLFGGLTTICMTSVALEDGSPSATKIAATAGVVTLSGIGSYWLALRRIEREEQEFTKTE